jgi:hypothetical protein
MTNYKTRINSHLVILQIILIGLSQFTFARKNAGKIRICIIAKMSDNSMFDKPSHSNENKPDDF